MDAPELCLAAAEQYRKGDVAGAERLCRQALVLDAKNFSALHLLGALCGAAGRAQEALAHFAAARAVNPASASAALNHGLALQALGRDAEALECFTRATELKPDLAAAHYNRANLLAASEPHAALDAYDRALAADPAYVEALGNRAGLLAALGRSDNALADYARALALRPGDPVLSRNRGQLLRQLRQPQKALDNFDQALSAKPDWAEARDDRGAAQLALGRNSQALADFSRAAALAPDFVPAHLHKAVALLMLGRLEEAWPLLELRHKLFAPRQVPGPRWTGREDIKGKRLFIWWEEGLGDLIWLFRYALLARQQGAHVILSAPDKMLGLLSDAGTGVELIGADATPANFDFHIPLFSLPLAFGTRLETIPAATPYLKADPKLVREWASVIGTHGFRIGIVWATTAGRSLGRSFPLAALKEISGISGVRLISLQKTDGIAELAEAGMKVETLHGLDEGPDAFRDSAAVMENLDLVISADTAAAHLAGALARPTWLALQFAADWKWLEARGDSPWYPGMRLFRQEKPDDWSSVFAPMARALPALMRR